MILPPEALATFSEPEMNKTEKRYADELDNQIKVGLIKWWRYEAFKIRLANRTWYTPDFCVVTADDKLEGHEIKAFWQNLNRAGWREDARIKIKVAAELFPARFRAAVLMEDGRWEFEEFTTDSAAGRTGESQRTGQ